MLTEQGYLGKFFAVTTTSVYQVVAKGEGGFPYAEKIALRGESDIPIGGKIKSGGMIAIARRLQAFIPDGYGLATPLCSIERRLEMVNVSWWQGRTSEIVALFLEQDAALDCFQQLDLEVCDPRWEKQTRQVIESIGDEHPKFSVCRHPGLALPLAL